MLCTSSKKTKRDALLISYILVLVSKGSVRHLSNHKGRLLKGMSELFHDACDIPVTRLKELYNFVLFLMR